MIVGDVPQGASPQQTAPLIRLLMLVNDVSLRNLIAPELGKGFGFLQSKGQTAFSPVAVTPDELGAAFDGGKVSSASGLPRQRRAVRPAQRRCRHDV